MCSLSAVTTEARENPGVFVVVIVFELFLEAINIANNKAIIYQAMAMLYVCCISYCI